MTFAWMTFGVALFTIGAAAMWRGLVSGYSAFLFFTGIVCNLCGDAVLIPLIVSMFG